MDSDENEDIIKEVKITIEKDIEQDSIELIHLLRGLGLNTVLVTIDFHGKPQIGVAIPHTQYKTLKTLLAEVLIRKDEI